MSVKQRLHSAIEDLPEGVTLEEALELGSDEIQRALEEGEADVSAGRAHSHAEVAARYRALLDGEP